MVLFSTYRRAHPPSVVSRRVRVLVVRRRRDPTHRRRRRAIRSSRVPPSRFARRRVVVVVSTIQFYATLAHLALHARAADEGGAERERARAHDGRGVPRRRARGRSTRDGLLVACDRIAPDARPSWDLSRAEYAIPTPALKKCENETSHGPRTLALEVARSRSTRSLSSTRARLTMINADGENVDLYIPRKCSWTNRLITAKDKASVQLNVGHLDANGVYDGRYTTVALAGYVRSKVRARARCDGEEMFASPGRGRRRWGSTMRARRGDRAVVERG
jgi:small subunit ribosomal protein S21e|tara:strand:+ start:6340 stop:7167 length:828 start_codon:yes stop_codon:yes gene_type:complete